MQNSPDVEDLLAKARIPSEEAMRLHPVYRGKLEVTLKCPIRDFFRLRHLVHTRRCMEKRIIPITA